jgi:hypothetical protein
MTDSCTNYRATTLKSSVITYILVTQTGLFIPSTDIVPIPKRCVAPFFAKATMAQPITFEEGPSAHPWAAPMPIQDPPFCLQLAERGNHLVISGEMVKLRDPLATTILHKGKKITLHAPVGRILRIEYPLGQAPRALINLFFYPFNLPTFPLRALLPPPNHIYIQYPPKLFGATMSNGFLKPS